MCSTYSLVAPRFLVKVQMFVSSGQLKYCCSRASQLLTKVRGLTCLINLKSVLMTCIIPWREFPRTFIFSLFLLFLIYAYVLFFPKLVCPSLMRKKCHWVCAHFVHIRNIYWCCAGCGPGGPWCCGFVPDTAGEEQLERDGLEVGPQRVKNEWGEIIYL